MTKAIYPATFDPIHYGHIDIIRRATTIFDELIVGVYDRPVNKNLLFDLNERIALVKESVAEIPQVRVMIYNSLTVDFASQVGARAIIRGLRVVSDFEFEWRMALTNKQLAPDIEVVCLMTSQDYSYISSSTVREVALLNGDVSSLVPPHIANALATKAATIVAQQPS